MAIDKENLYVSFQAKFPLEKLKTLTLEEYTDIQQSGKNRDDFTYWVETKVDKVGGISLYSSHYGIYKFKNNPEETKRLRHDEDYVWDVKYGLTRDEAWENVRSIIYSIARFSKEGRFSEIEQLDLPTQYKWKIAFLYSDKKITNIFRKSSLEFLAHKYCENANEKMSFSELTVLIREKCIDNSRDYWKQADRLWEECKAENERAKTFPKTMLEEICSEIESNPEFSDFRYVDNTDDFKNKKDSFFFWIGLRDSVLGNKECHYEIIFDKDAFHSQIHFEEMDTKQMYINGLKSIPEVVNTKRKNALGAWFEIASSGVSIEGYDVDNIKRNVLENLILLDGKVRDVVLKVIKGNKDMDDCREYIDLLKNTRNLILTGAPGTGKTFLAKKMAEAMVGEGHKENIVFTQFHQSYDYTDFVEGLRPTKSVGDEMGFECVDGIFKSFCKSALKNLIDSGKSKEEINLETVITKEFESFCEDIRSGEENRLELKTTDKHVLLNGCNNDSTVIYVKPLGSELHEYSISLDKILQLAGKFKNVKDVENAKLSDIRNCVSGHKSYNWALLYRIYQRIAEKPAVTNMTKVERQNFVFIIDEINRGEISKIFGELFYAIDPTCRVTTDNLRKKDFEAITTQYSNMNNEPNLFDRFIENNQYGHFFVPDNVYIIGTMNDIDRGVESLDFAFRRRFAWIEIAAKDTQESILRSIQEKPEKGITVENLQRVMDGLNEKIWKDKDDGIEGLSSAYHLGAAYFLKIQDYADMDNPYQMLWKYNLEPLLREYLRGMDDSVQVICELSEVYQGMVEDLEHAD